VAGWDEPHWLSTVVAAVEIGSPAVSHAVRVMLKPCMPTWLTHPPTTCPTSAGSMPARSINSFCTIDNASAEWNVDMPPPRRPIGERTASTMTTSLPLSSDMQAAYGSHELRVDCGLETRNRTDIGREGGFSSGGGHVGSGRGLA